MSLGGQSVVKIKGRKKMIANLLNGGALKVVLKAGWGMALDSLAEIAKQAIKKRFMVKRMVDFLRWGAKQTSTSWDDEAVEEIAKGLRKDGVL